MNYEEFKDAVKNRVKDYLPQQYADWEVKDMELCKVNEKVEAFSLVSPDAQTGKAAAPVIYYETLYDFYKSGTMLGDVLSNIAGLIQDGKRYSEIEQRCIAIDDYNYCRDKVIIEVINRDTNKELLETLIHREYLTDLAIVYRIVVGNQESTLITNILFSEWGITEAELFSNAYYNTPNRSEFKLESMGAEFGVPDEMLILTNEDGIFGAAGMMYPEKLNEAAEINGGNFYLLPSSLHELILVDVEGKDVNMLKDLVKTINTVMVAPADYLSDNVYYYDRETELVKAA